MSKAHANPMFGYFETPPAGTIWGWAEENIVIPARTPTNFPGAYRSDLAVFTRDILDLLQDPKVNTVVLEKGAQVGATITATVALAYWCAVDPGPVLLVYPSEDGARSQSETRVMPIFEESPALAALIPNDRKSCWTKLQYRLRKNVVNWAGSHSPANLASRAIKYLVLDEVDKYPEQSGDEADPVSLAIQRTKTYGARKKIFIMSTPTSSTGQIHRRFLEGDQRRLYLPCPHCGLMQTLQWTQVKFDSTLPTSEAAAGARYECPGCKGRIMDGHKAGMLAKREWRSSAVSSDPSAVSLHLSSLYSPWVTWSYLVRSFLKAKADPKSLQDFINSELGEPFDPIDMRIYDETLAAREGEYPDGNDWAEHRAYQKRFDGLVRNQDYATFGGVDVQKGYLRAVFRTFTRNGDSGRILCQELSGFDALLKLVDSLKAEYVGVDSLYRASEVLEFCFTNPGFYPIHGVVGKNAPLVTPENEYDIDEGKKRKGPEVRTLTRFAIADNQAKDLLASCVQQTDKAPLWLLGKGAASDKVYCSEMTAEARINGKWVNPRQAANHYWDAEKIALAMAVAFGYWRWGDTPEPGEDKKQREDGE
jgi:hypothetical protein